MLTSSSKDDEVSEIKILFRLRKIEWLSNKALSNSFMQIKFSDIVHFQFVKAMDKLIGIVCPNEAQRKIKKHTFLPKIKKSLK